MNLEVIPFIIFYLFCVSLVPTRSSLYSSLKIELYQKNIVLFFVFLFLWGWGVVGYDTKTYYSFYEKVPVLNDFFSYDVDREILFYLWMSLCKTCNISYIIFRLINTFIDLIVLFYFFNYFLDIKLFPLAFVIYILYGGMYFEIEAIRNAKALSCFFISLIKFSKKQYLRFVLWNVIGFYFHIMIIILSFSMIFYRLFLKRKFVLFLFIIGCFIVILGKGLGFVIISISSYIPGIIGEIIVRYVLNDSYNISHGLTIGFLERFFVFILIFKFQKKLELNYSITKVFISFFYIYILISFYFIDFTIVYERVASMYKFSYWILIPMVYKYFSKSNKYTFYAGLVLYGLLKVYQQYNNIIYRIYWDLLK